TASLSLGLGTIFFGSVHVLARGFWLVRFALDGPAPSSVSDRIASLAYVALHQYWSLLVAYLIIIAPGGLLMPVTDQLLVKKFGWPPGLARGAFAALMAATVMVLLKVFRVALERVY